MNSNSRRQHPSNLVRPPLGPGWPKPRSRDMVKGYRAPGSPFEQMRSYYQGRSLCRLLIETFRNSKLSFVPTQSPSYFRGRSRKSHGCRQIARPKFLPGRRQRCMNSTVGPLLPRPAQAFDRRVGLLRSFEPDEPFTTYWPLLTQ